MTLSCGHALGYKLTSAHRPACLACTPPHSRPTAVGLVQPDHSLLTVADILAHRMRTNRAAAARDCLANTRRLWPDGGWEITDAGPCDAAGWPLGSLGLAYTGEWRLLLLGEPENASSARADARSESQGPAAPSWLQGASAAALERERASLGAGGLRGQVKGRKRRARGR